MIIQRSTRQNPRHGPSCLFGLFVAIVLLLGGIVLVKADLFLDQFVPEPTAVPTLSAAAQAASAEQFVRDGRTDDAIIAYQSAVALDTDNAAYFQALVSLLLQAGRPEEAVQWARKGTTLVPDDDRPWAALAGANLAYGDRLAETGQPTDADLAYQQTVAAANTAVQLNPQNAAAHAYLAGGLAQSGQHLDFPKAQALAEYAVALDPESVVARRQFGAVLQAQGFFGDAIAQYEAAIALAPDQAPLYTELAYLYFFTERRQQAILTMQEALKQDPNNAVALDGLSYFFFLEEDYPEAEERARQAIALDPALVRAHAHLGAARYRQKKYADAIGPLAQAIERYGRATAANAVYFNMLGLAYAQSDPARCDEAIPLFQAVLTVAPSDSTAENNATEGLVLCGALPPPTAEPTTTSFQYSVVSDQK